MKRVWFFAALSGFALAGCQALEENRAAYSRLHDIPAGSTLELHAPVEIPADKRNVYIQNGEHVAYWHLDQWYPYCELILRGLPAHERQVHPDTFVIERSQRYYDMHGDVRAPMLAGLGVGFEFGVGAANGGDDGGPSPWLYITELQLRSQRNPAVEKLLCGHLQDPPLAEYLTIDQVRKAMGDLFTLHLAPHRAPGG